MSAIPRLLDDRPRRRIAILVDDSTRYCEEVFSRAWPKARLTVLDVTSDESSLHVEMAASGPFSLIVDCSEGRSRQSALFGLLLFHLRHRGVLAISGFDSAATGDKSLWSLLQQVLTTGRTPDGQSAGNDLRSMADAIDEVLLGRDHVLVRRVGRSLAKLREAEGSRLLEITGDRIGQTLDRIDGELFHPRSQIRDHRDETRVRDQGPIEVPALSLRVYHEVVCAPPQVVTKDHVLLPETYRHHLHARLANRMIADLAPRFGEIKRDVTEAAFLTGTYFHWDSEWPGHFGHVLTEQVSRLWGLVDARERYPDLRVLVGRRPRETRAMSFEREILSAFDVQEDDIQLYDKPVRVERLVAATPMFSMPNYISPRIAETWAVIGEKLGAMETGTTPRRFFCGRDKQTRLCRNAADVEQTFVGAGFEVVYPEKLPFPAQIAMFREAEVIAGYAGSALFTMEFCDAPKRMLVLSPDSYWANNEYLIGAVMQHEFDVFWSKAERAPGAKPNLSSGFTFDFEREGLLLRKLLADLD